LFVGVNGVVKIEVKQKSPLARYVGAEEVFYIDSQGNKMPLSDNFSARVPLISGDLNAIPRVKLSSLLQSIEADDFLKKNIVSIEILKDGDIKMQNRNFNYIIAFGKTINMDRKFSNYKAFFQKAVSDSTLYNYRTINLKFTQQVVCIK
jgi:cell division protein FtsQ